MDKELELAQEIAFYLSRIASALESLAEDVRVLVPDETWEPTAEEYQSNGE